MASRITADRTRDKESHWRAVPDPPEATLFHLKGSFLQENRTNTEEVFTIHKMTLHLVGIMANYQAMGNQAAVSLAKVAEMGPSIRLRKQINQPIT